MKLFELAPANPSKQAAKVFESYFDDRINVDVMSARQARFMLNKVRGLMVEHRQTSAIHHSERNPAYLKLMMMEKVLAAKVKETSTVPVGATAGATQNQQNQQANMAMPNPTVAADQAAAKAKRDSQINNISDPQLKAAMLKANQGQALNPQDSQMIATAALQTENLQVRRQIYRVLRESEVQQAQVVLAAQDMIDEVQKMLEDVTSMQFKDLPALVDQIKNQLGLEQATQFNTDAAAALGSLTQSVQSAKGQLDQALGILIGQAVPAEIPGQGDMTAEPDMDLDMTSDAAPEELPAPESDETPEPQGGDAELGRAKRR
jgi:hypothetical protein